MKIAVFDSGFGSISIIREIQKIFKGELIYFADQKNFPYGVKSKKELEDIIKDTVDLLEEKFSPDFIIMASNTPTLLLWRDINRISPHLAGIYPPISDAVKISRTRNIAILGTRSVIQSESITKFIEKCDVPDHIVVHKIDCSLLVELVESGKFLTDKEYCKNIIKEVLEDILSDVPKEKIDERILNFKDKMKTMDIDEIATPTTVKGMSKYLQADEQNTSMFSRYYKGTPVHVKAALAYNDLLKHFKRDKKYSKIENISKIKWVYLKKNQYGLETLAYKGHEDPIEILSFIRESVDYDKIYSKSLKKKITMFYDTMDWGEPTDASKTIERFF